MAHLAAAYQVLERMPFRGVAAAAAQQLRLLSCAAEPDVDAVVIGAGVVGLAIARQLVVSGSSVMLLEAAGAIGTKTSSRNSEVIHAGLYYPPGSLKAQLCVQGKELLYYFCERYSVPFRRLGKLVVATSEGQVPALHALRARAAENGVGDLQQLSGAKVAEMEPAVRCTAALLSPSTGIVDSHSLMSELHRQFEAAGGTTAFHSRVVGGSVSERLKRVVVQDVNSKEEVELRAAAVVNAAGLHAQAVAASLQGMPPSAIPPLYLAKGSYYSLSPGRLASRCFNHLIYPLPEPGTAGLGVHLTLDLAGGVRFGPDVEWLPPGTDPQAVDYSVNPARAQPFYAAIRAYLPSLPDGALQPSYSGVRPKVTGPRQPAGDFVLQGPQRHGIPGLLNLFGIESPALTASLAIAKRATEALLKAC